MKRLLLIAIGALVLPAAALGKGPVEATITGPGLGKPIVLSGVGKEPTPVGALAESTGFFRAAFSPEESALLQGRPPGDLGPKYTITYKIPTKIRQYAYPYANPPVAYLPPGQDLFGADVTRGGWFRAGTRLKTMLVSAGLPKESPGGSSRPDQDVVSAGLISLLGAALLLGATTAFVLRRRARPQVAA
jgi:hypothetical protein